MIIPLSFMGTQSGGGGTEKFSQDNAASIDTEVNATTGWTQTNCTMTSDATTSSDGSYSIKGVATSATSAAVRYEFSATAGKTYTISMWAKRGAVGTNQELRSWTNTNENPNIAVTSTTWTEYNTVDTPVSTAAIQMRFYATRTAGSIGDEIYVDEISVIET